MGPEDSGRKGRTKPSKAEAQRRSLRDQEEGQHGSTAVLLSQDNLVAISTPVTTCLARFSMYPPTCGLNLHLVKFELIPVILKFYYWCFKNYRMSLSHHHPNSV